MTNRSPIRRELAVVTAERPWSSKMGVSVDVSLLSSDSSYWKRTARGSQKRHWKWIFCYRWMFNIDTKMCSSFGWSEGWEARDSTHLLLLLLLLNEFAKWIDMAVQWEAESRKESLYSLILWSPCLIRKQLEKQRRNEIELIMTFDVIFSASSGWIELIINDTSHDIKILFQHFFHHDEKLLQPNPRCEKGNLPVWFRQQCSSFSEHASTVGCEEPKSIVLTNRIESLFEQIDIQLHGKNIAVG